MVRAQSAISSIAATIRYCLRDRIIFQDTIYRLDSWLCIHDRIKTVIEIMARKRATSVASEHSSHTAAEELGSMYDYLAKVILLGPSGSGKYAYDIDYA